MKAGGGTASTPDDDGVPARLFQQAIEAQEPRFAAGYELERAWAVPGLAGEE